MIRKLLVVAAAIAMPVSVIAVSGGVASAKAPTGVAADTIHCTTESANVVLNPPLTPAGKTTGSAAVTHVTSSTGSVSGCTVSGATSEGALVTGTISGTIYAKKAPSAKHPGSTCVGLLGTTKSGKGSTITIAWAHGTTAIPNSVIALKEVIGGSSGSPAHGSFNIIGKSSGSFLGLDKGKSSSLLAETVLTTQALTAECTPSPGIGNVAIQATPSGISLK